jgi:hypothetical protein
MRENRTNAINMSLLRSSRVFGLCMQKVQTLKPEKRCVLFPKWAFKKGATAAHPNAIFPLKNLPGYHS